MVCTLPDGKKVSMPRYYKEKIYDEYTRIMFGKLGLEAMQEKKNKLLSQYGITIEEFEQRRQVQTDAMYKNQISKSAKRQKHF